MRNYVVFDLEWNQSPMGKEGSNEKIPFEIIEIGAVKLNEDFRIISEFHELIKPQVYKQIHYKISEVTHMDIKELEKQGRDFKSACESFIKWCGDEYVFCTWGAMDLTELQRNMEYFKVENIFAKPLIYYDVQKLYSLLYTDGKEKHSLDQIVEELGLLEERGFHRALDDAYYTGKVMSAIDFERIKEFYSVDYYRIPKDISEEVYIEFSKYSKYISREFDTKEEAIADKTVTEMVCYKCKRMLRKKVRWFSFNQKIYLALAWCPQHGYVKGKIRMKKSEAGGIYAVKTLKIIDQNEADNIYNRKEELKKRRSQKSKLKKLEKREQD